jgi:hypothetical protein
VNQHSQRRIKELIYELEEPFTAQNVKTALIEKHGTAYTPSNISLGQFLNRICIRIGKHRGRFLYKVKTMKKKIVKVEVTYDTEETWETTLQEVKELFQMMNNIKRNAIIIDIQGDKDDDGQNE